MLAIIFLMAESKGLVSQARKTGVDLFSDSCRFEEYTDADKDTLHHIRNSNRRP